MIEGINTLLGISVDRFVNEVSGVGEGEFCGSSSSAIEFATSVPVAVVAVSAKRRFFTEGGAVEVGRVLSEQDGDARQGKVSIAGVEGSDVVEASDMEIGSRGDIA